MSTDTLANFIPTSTMTFAEKLNAMMRFAIYFSIMVVVVKRDVRYVYIVLFVALFTLLLYTVYERDRKEMYSKHEKEGTRYHKHTKKVCTLPSKDNPFANILVSDYKYNPKRNPGCNISKSKMKRRVNAYFNHNLYRDVDDIWHRKSSSRNFYQTPIQTIPNQQTEFAQWLYGRGRSCKQGSGARCMQNQM
jgi:Ca2+/Na+ antiporter